MEDAQTDVPQIGVYSAHHFSRQQVLRRRVLQRRVLPLTFPSNSHLTQINLSRTLPFRRPEVAQLQRATTTIDPRHAVTPPREGKEGRRGIAEIDQEIEHFHVVMDDPQLIVIPAGIGYALVRDVQREDDLEENA